jgi:ABC-type Fe3+-hydroxamate transport system substrate-binding protein
MAAFFNKEEEAERIFESKVTAMRALKQNIPTSDSDKPVVAWIEKTWDGKVKLSTADYQKVLVEYAGGKMVDAAAVKSAMGSKMDDSHQTESLPDFIDALKDVDAVIDLTYSSDVATYDFDFFLKEYGLNRSSNLPFIRNEKVFRVDLHISGKSNLDWFESRLIEPDMAVEGLHRVLKPDSSKPMKYFRNIATGEVPVVVDMDACTKKLMTCNPSDMPEALPMIDKLGEVSSAIGQLSMSAFLAAPLALMMASPFV